MRSGPIRRFCSWESLACILIGILSIGVVLMLLMNRMITVPVSRLQTRMVRIAGGDFSRDPSVEWDHELGDIGRGINDLSENVSELMEKRLEDEKQKQDLEYKMLQSQINPHFLFNCLNAGAQLAMLEDAERTGVFLEKMADFSDIMYGKWRMMLFSGKRWMQLTIIFIF